MAQRQQDGDHRDHVTEQMTTEPAPGHVRVKAAEDGVLPVPVRCAVRCPNQDSNHATIKSPLRGSW